MSTIKVTPEQLHHVSSQVDQARQQLEHIQNNLSRQIMFLQAMWMGVTQERFYDDFARSRPVLQKALESMVYTSKELKDIATRFEQADAEKDSLASIIGAVGAAAMMKNFSAHDAGSEDKGYRMAQVNIYSRLMWLPVNENGVTDQAALQAYKKDQGHLDINRMQAGHAEEPGEDIFALQIKAFENRIHPFTGEPVSDKYAQMMLTSLKFSQIFMAFQMVRGSIPGRKGPFRLPASDPAVAKIKKNLEANAKRTGKVQTGGKSDIFDPDEYLRNLDKADEMYDTFRSSTTDVASITRNTGMKESRVQRIKEHLFIKEHIKDHGVGRFDADLDIAQAWERLQKGKYKQSDIDLLNHELFESRFEGIFKTNYRTAHDKTLESGRPWNP